MERTYIKDVVPGVCKVQGFVENFRNKKNMAFIVVKDITGKLQVTVIKEEHPEMLEMLDKLTINSVVTFEGEVVASEYVKLGGKSRGSAIYSSNNGQAPNKMEDVFRFELDDGSNDATVLEITYNDGKFTHNTRSVRPLPEGGGFFENVWREYRTNKNIY